MHICDALAVLSLSYAAYTDGKIRRIPDATVLLISACAAAKALLNRAPPWPALLGGAVVGAAMLFTGLDGIGGGDIKLITALGVLYGFPDAVTVVVLATLGMVAFGHIKRKQAMPFAPFLLAAVILFHAKTIFFKE